MACKAAAEALVSPASVSARHALELADARDTNERRGGGAGAGSCPRCTPAAHTHPALLPVVIIATAGCRQQEEPHQHKRKPRGAHFVSACRCELRVQDRELVAEAMNMRTAPQLDQPRTLTACLPPRRYGPQCVALQADIAWTALLLVSCLLWGCRCAASGDAVLAAAPAPPRALLPARLLGPRPLQAHGPQVVLDLRA